MPELVDVEGFRRVAERAVGDRVVDVAVYDRQVLRGTTEQALRRVLHWRRVGPPRRHGKWLVLPVVEPGIDPGVGTGEGNEAALLLHFGMTGSLHWCDADAERHRHDRLEIVLDGGALRYRDVRKLTGVWLATSAEQRQAVLGTLGPDALEMTAGQLAGRLAGVRRQLKPALMDQKVIAGLGNLLVDEILWRAGLHPQRSARELDPDEVRRLHGRMRSVLRAGSRAGRVPSHASWLTGHRDRPGDRCPRCGTVLARGRSAGRSTVWCPSCQPRQPD